MTTYSRTDEQYEKYTKKSFKDNRNLGDQHAKKLRNIRYFSISLLTLSRAWNIVIVTRSFIIII